MLVAAFNVSLLVRSREDFWCACTLAVPNSKAMFNGAPCGKIFASLWGALIGTDTKYNSDYGSSDLHLACALFVSTILFGACCLSNIVF
jgi:hypothetical protein